MDSLGGERPACNSVAGLRVRAPLGPGCARCAGFGRDSPRTPQALSFPSAGILKGGEGGDSNFLSVMNFIYLLSL